MSKSQIISGKENREKLLRGVNIMADAVGSSLGPRGQNTAIAKSTPQGEVYDRIVLHDGVSIARAIDLQDEYENMGAQLIAEASKKQVDKVGDGTTVTMIIAQSIVNECAELMASGVNPMSLRVGLEKGAELLTNELVQLAKPIKSKREMTRIATISAADPKLGHQIASTLLKLGKDGVINVEYSNSHETTVEFQEGMQLDKGYVSPWFVTNPTRMEAILENAYYLITDKPLTILSELDPLIQELVQISKNIVIISPEIGGEALPLLINNKQRGALFTLGIQAPSMGQDQKNILHDLAILTGGKFISQEAGWKFSDVKVEDLGFAEYICATKESTTIAGGRGEKKEIEKRITTIKKALEVETNQFDIERMRARLGKLTDGVAIIRVGGDTEVEMKERRERVLDAVAATRAAMDRGIVPGGEVVYLHIREKLKEKPFVKGKKGSHLLELAHPITDKILYKSLYKPFQKLITNAGFDEIDVALRLHKKKPNFGIDVIDGEVKNMIKAGIIDPVAVSIEAIKNAVSVSILIITTLNTIVPVIEKK